MADIVVNYLCKFPLVIIVEYGYGSVVRVVFVTFFPFGFQ